MIVSYQGKDLYVAGAHQYYALWLRDTCIASPHMDPVITRNTLNVFLQCQKDGELPKVIGLDESSTMTNLIGVMRMPRKRAKVVSRLYPMYVDELGTRAIDSWLWWMYAMVQVHAKEEARQHLKAVIAYYSRYQSEGLILQPPHSDFQDSSGHGGYSFMTNLLYWKVLRDFGDARAEVLAQKLENFWSPERKAYRTFLHDAEHISLPGNLFALEWELPGAKAHMKLIKQSDLCVSRPGFVTTPAWSHTAWFLSLLGIADYHGPSVYWVWLMAFAARVLKKKCTITLPYEVLDVRGRPIDYFLGYKSETCFLMSVAFLSALRQDQSI